MRDDRRSRHSAVPRLSGRRSTDPILTTRDCADRLGVSTGFIVGEIRGGRLAAFALKRRHRTVYRVAPAELADYLDRYRIRSG